MCVCVHTLFLSLSLSALSELLKEHLAISMLSVHICAISGVFWTAEQEGEA